MTSSSKQGTLIHESSNSLIYYYPTSTYDRPVVVKVLNTNSPAPQQLVRWNNEYEITGGLVIDGVRKVIAQTRFEDKPALVLEYITGQTLKQAFVEQRQSLVGFLQVAIQIAHILSQIHQRHIIHRAISSDHILVEPETKQVKIIDFSLASQIDLRVQHLGNPEALAGDLAYISPEQTGRMNRVVDYRADLYSLGVVFYEMLTGGLPFDNNDPLALVHAHMAKAPQPVNVLNPDIPPLISDIVKRLLAKNAEDRYQSAPGLKTDLERCLAYLEDRQGSNNPMGLDFDLGQDDYSGQFHMPQKLYGRSVELARLLASFDRTAAGSQELVLVAGYAGVGKSALVAEVHKPITEKRGYFISGKFDQYQQNTPYTAFIQAFNQLADLLLTERETTLHQWRDKILAAVGSNGAVLTEVIPSLVNVIGSQPVVERLGGQESRNRFNFTFQSFVQAIGTAEHPLVVFVDDWQWADSASLELLKFLLTNEGNAHILLLAAYRDNEVDQTHPFSTTLNGLTAAGVRMQTIKLDNLQPADVQQLIQESLACSAADSQALTELVYAKTQGNAFFTRQFLQNLYEEGWLRFDFSTRRWTWDITQLRTHNITDNVADLMAGRLKKLYPGTANLLQLAACIGNEFDLQTLAVVGQMSRAATTAGLAEALIQGLVIPLDDYYKLPGTSASARFIFLHDRVQQAAYAQIPDPERQTVHLKIGRLLLANTPEADLNQRVFDIVQHYNQAEALITSDTERLRLAELNMQAADMAYEAAAFKSAQAYLETALALMPADAWANQYDRMLKIHSQLATALSLTGNFEELDRIFQITEAQAHTMADTAQAKQAKIQALLSRGNNAEGIELGLTFIEAVMGAPINRNPSSEEAFNYLQETAEWLTPTRIETIPHLPDAPAEIGLIYEIAVVINAPIYNSNMNLCLVFVSRITRLCLEQGLALWAPVTLVTFALLLNAALHDIPKVRLLTTVTRKLFEEKYPSDSLISSLSTAIGGFIVHRYEHLKHTLPVFTDGVAKGLASGTFEFVAYCAWWHAWHHLFLGGSLVEAEAVSEQAVETCQKVQMERLKDWSLLVHQVSLNLQGKCEVSWILKGDAYDEQEKLALAFQVNDMADIFRIFFYKAWLHYLFDQLQPAVDLFRENEAYLLYGVGTYLTPLFYFYDTLANAAIWDRCTIEQQLQVQERINRNLEQVEVWVRFAPMNHQHKQDLMAAEKARLEGQYWAAVTLYEKAIQGARNNEFLSEEALANELFGQFWLSRGNNEIAYLYLQRAQNIYGLWGARAKVKQMQARYRPVLSRSHSQSQDLEDTSQMGLTGQLPMLNRQTTQNWLDIASVLKANQTLSQTVNLSDLLAEMMKILLENAGAEKAFILYQDEGTWFIEARGEVRGQAYQTGLHLPLSETDLLSTSVFNYVINSGKIVVLADAGEDAQFGADTYLRESGVKSILCLPIWYKGELKLVLYLENNLTAGAFTEDRLELLQMLSGQMAISIENALMYNYLETLVARRTAELAEAKARAEAASQAKSVFLAHMSHELRTPLTGILGYTQLLKHDNNLSPSQIDGLNVMQHSGEHLLTLINDILDMAKIEAGKVELTAAPLHLPGFLTGVVRIIQARADAKNLPLSYIVRPPLPQGVVVDEKRLRQVLLNLLGNAIKFTDQGGVTLTVEQLDQVKDASGQPQARLCFTVEDTGTGISPAELEQIFRPFEQVGQVNRQTEGAGLGLAISQQIVTLMGGQIQVKSELGRGSTFWFEISLPTVEGVVMRGFDAPLLPIGYEGSRRKALVADDKEYNRLVLKKMLTLLGFEVVTANDGQQAVAQALAERPQVIFMDLVMPGQSGFEAIQELRQRAEMQEVIIITVSASVMASDREKSQVMGSNAFLAKPVKQEELVALLEQLLGLRWIYAEPENAPDTSQEAETALFIPPPTQLTALYELIQLGKLRQFRERLSKLEQKDAAYRPFVKKLQTLARGYEVRQIQALLQHYLEENL